METERKNACLKESIILRQEDDGGFVFDSDTGHIAVVNPIGFAILKLIQTQMPIEEIVRILGRKYPRISPKQLKEDADRFITTVNSFLNGGVVENPTQLKENNVLEK